MRMLPLDYAVRNLSRSPMRLLSTVGGCALVATIVIAAVAFVRGMQRSLTVHSTSNNVILLGAGSEESIERSQVSAAVPSHIQAGVKGIKERLGRAFVSPEIHMAMMISRPGQEEELRALMRGVTDGAFLVHPRVQIIEGRAPIAGHNELAVGALAADRLGIPASDLAIGQALELDGQIWEIVGRIGAPGTVMDGEIWTSLTDLQVATKRDTLSCVVVTLEEAELEDLEAWTAIRLDLELVALSEAAYYSSIHQFYRPVRAMIWATAVLIAMAGVLGGLNTLYAAFAARTRELGMLRSLGFSRSAILASLVQESVLAASGGAIIGSLLGMWLLDGRAVRFSMGVFELQVDAPCLFAGIVSGLLLGFVGALPPAIRCLRLPVASALRTT